MSETTGTVAAASSAAPSTTAATPAPSAPSAPASATTTSAAPESASAATTTAPGPIPFDRHESILKGAYKERDDFRSKYERLSWAEQFHSDPYAFVDSWVDQLAAHPQYGAQMYAKAARMLQSRRGAVPQPQPMEKPKPDVPIMDGNGHITGYTYSDKQQDALDEWRWQQREAKLAERLQPLESMRQSIEHQQTLAQIQQESAQHAQTTLTELRKDPYFTEHEPQVKQALMDHPEWGDDIYRAYHHVLQTAVFPSITHKAEGRVLDTLKTQAVGGTVNPSGTSASGRPDFSKAKDPWRAALEYYDSHPDEAAALLKR